MDYYRRKLPHRQPRGAEYFVTFRLSGSLPGKVINDLKLRRDKVLNMRLENQDPDQLKRKIERLLFKKYESILDGAESGPQWLKKKHIAGIVSKAIHYRDAREYDLYAYCIMSNHVHMVFRHLEHANKLKSYPVTFTLQNLKSYTALMANRELKRTGEFWHAESYDHIIRNKKELARVISYTLNNPVKAEIVDHWKDWEFSYCKPEFIGSVMECE
jgi:putative transposase